MPTVITSGEPMEGTRANDLIADTPGGSPRDSTINGNDGHDLIFGDSNRFFFSYVDHGNNRIGLAQGIDNPAYWSASANNPTIDAAAGPHTSVYIEPGAYETRFFAVSIGANETIRLSLNLTNGSSWSGTLFGSSWSATNVGMYLRERDGTILASGVSDLSYTPTTAGIYYIQVWEFPDRFPYPQFNQFEGGEQIFLNVSVTNHEASAAPMVAGDDTINGGWGNDIILGMLGTDTVHGDGGDDRIFSSGSGRYYGDDGRDQIHAAEGTETVHGGPGNDVIYGTGAGRYYGNGGNDTIYAGTDTAEILNGGPGIDWLDTSNWTGDRTVDLRSLDGFENLQAGAGNDTLSGTAGVNTIQAGDGNDVVEGLDGADSLHGEDGNDTLTGGDGNDYLEGGTGVDTLDGGNGDDSVVMQFAGGAAAHGGAGNDWLRLSNLAATGVIDLNGNAFQGADSMVIDGFENLHATLSTGDLTVNGTASANILLTGTGNDTLNGRGGDDELRSGLDEWGSWEDDGDDILNGGGGNDWLDGGDGNDILNGNAGDDIIWNSDGTDILNGGAGNDVLEAGSSRYSGVDVMRGNAGDDVYYVDDPNDVVIERIGNGVDSVVAWIDYVLPNHFENLQLDWDAQSGQGNALDNIILGNRFLADTISGLDGNDELRGYHGDDELVGGRGKDLLSGGTGADTLRGESGSDVYYVDEAGDAVIERAGQGMDRVKATVDYVLPDNVERLVMLGPAQAGTGNELANVVKGTEGANTIAGLGGGDELFGNAGDDALDGGNGADVLAGGAGMDTMAGAAGADRFVFGDGDTAATRADADVILDFSQADGDRIRLTGLDADTTTSGNQDFAFIGEDAFSGAAGQLRFAHDAGNTFVEGDTDGDGAADFVICLNGLIDLMADDFVL